jgi:hypothetical protein
VGDGHHIGIQLGVEDAEARVDVREAVADGASDRQGGRPVQEGQGAAGRGAGGQGRRRVADPDVARMGIAGLGQVGLARQAMVIQILEQRLGALRSFGQATGLGGNNLPLGRNVELPFRSRYTDAASYQESLQLAALNTGDTDAQNLARQ